MAQYQAMAKVVAMVQNTISRKAQGNPVTVIEARQMQAQDGHGRDAARLVGFWVRYVSKVVDWTDFGDCLRVNTEFKMG